MNHTNLNLIFSIIASPIWISTPSIACLSQIGQSFLESFELQRSFINIELYQEKERMEEINHFSHKDHPLKLVESWETIVGGGDNDVCCAGCQDPILDGSAAYGCIACHYFLHKNCAQLELTFTYRFHPLDPLTLIPIPPSIGKLSCDVCSRRAKVGLIYNCSPCNFDVCMKCAVADAAHNAATARLREEASNKFKHDGHPQHTLTLQLRPASFHCDACRDTKEDLFYQCDNCDFWIHKTCASLALTINLPHHHHHPLFLVYSLPDNCYKYGFCCEFCNKGIMQTDWTYHCSNCRYFIHIKCVENMKQPSNPKERKDVKEEEKDDDILHFPMSEPFTDPLRLLHFGKTTVDDNEVEEINHRSHHHSLILNVGNNHPHDIGCSNPIEVCSCCVRPLSFPYYSCKDGCSFTLHKYCAELQPTLKHQLHPDHLLDLVSTGYQEDYPCNSCFRYGNTFVYKCETCNFYLDVNCAFLPKTIKHESHMDHLTQVLGTRRFCDACHDVFNCLSYSCKSCDFHLDMHCAVNTPHSLAHRSCKGHQIPLTYPPVEDHPEQFYCDICEREMHPKYTLYHCHKCKSSFCLQCLNRVDHYANVKLEGTINVSYHKHPLTFVRRKKTPHYVCFTCNRDINGFLILECRTGTCPFRTCYECHHDGT